MSKSVISAVLLALLLMTNVIGTPTPNNATENVEKRAPGDTCARIRTRRKWRALTYHRPNVVFETGSLILRSSRGDVDFWLLLLLALATFHC
ncbi:hypothetical protein FA15DRAFT_758910 [Coprinopsis marcescibilis]|uniref:Secreted protein n=1 Tax=Coprinopsis marcescibilis TaxID=230819 RepID=A0A5C3KL81_COPMA|nr:hypothetical protein FA15DRAFT_758910 [Coprinopsis marcescibilis]